MKKISAAEILFIHSAIIDTTGGSHHVRDLGLVESATERPWQCAFGHELYPSLFEKAAVLFDSIANFHPFVDGNKRTAISSAGVLLERNGIEMSATNKELERFTLQAVTGRYDVKKIAKWLKKHSRKVWNNREAAL